jgi:hypothetical protein
MGSNANVAHREPWNKGKIVGQKAPFKLKAGHLVQEDQPEALAQVLIDFLGECRDGDGPACDGGLRASSVLSGPCTRGGCRRIGPRACMPIDGVLQPGVAGDRCLDAAASIAVAMSDHRPASILRTLSSSLPMRRRAGGRRSRCVG